METLIIEGNSEQIIALKAFLKAVGMNFRTEPDTTDYLLSNPANKTELLDSIKEAKDGNLPADLIGFQNL